MTAFDVSLSRRSFARTSLAATIGIMAGPVVLRSAFAQDTATPAGEEGGGGLPPLPEGATLVAQGLFNPRFLEFGDDGTLYITENGVGGDEVLQAPGNGTQEGAATPGATPVGTPAEEAPAGAASTRGYTGQISQVTTDGTQTVIASGLASYSDGVGPVGLALGPNEIYFSIGGVAVEQGFELLDGEDALNVLDLATGEVSIIADLAAYEVANNLDGTDVNSNLYMIANAGGGNILVADAGANVIYTVNRDSGEITAAAVVPGLTELTGIEPTPDMGSGQPVPTSVTIGADGTVYVAVLRENWPAEAPSILVMAADGTFSPFATDQPLAFTVSLTAGPDGNLYASQLFGEMTAQGPGPGRVVRIDAAGAVTSVVEGIMMPHGVAFDAQGNLHVAINTLMSGPGMPAGQVIRIDGVAAV